jgi:hypothetical protein
MGPDVSLPVTCEILFFTRAIVVHLPFLFTFRLILPC